MKSDVDVLRERLARVRNDIRVSEHYERRLVEQINAIKAREHAAKTARHDEKMKHLTEIFAETARVGRARNRHERRRERSCVARTGYSRIGHNNA